VPSSLEELVDPFITSHSQPSVLVIDDDKITRVMLKGILKRVGIDRVVVAENGHLGIKALSENRIAVIFCDWNMTPLSGLEVLAHCRKDKKYREVPFIMLTAEGSKDKVKTAIVAGVSDYIVKPFSEQIIGTKMETLLKTIPELKGVE
jgi:two-component system, chemotaxis family, chemotaxis protein CheY